MRRLARRASAAVSIAAGAHAASCAHADGRGAVARSAEERLPLADVRFASASGVTVRAWFAAGRPGGGAVLLLHGIGASRHVMLGRAEFLHRQGFAVLLPDFRGHGESDAAPTTYGALESRDAAAALAWLGEHACGERVGVIGVSMGGAAALLGEASLRTDALVLESVYPTIREATADRLETWLGPLGFAGRWATPVALRWIGWRTGVGEAELRPIERIAEVRAPLLVLAGSDDPYTRAHEVRALFDRATAPKALWMIEGAKHEDLHAFAGTEYERRVGGFLALHLARVAADSSGAAPSQPEQRADRGDAPQCLDDEERRAEG